MNRTGTSSVHFAIFAPTKRTDMHKYVTELIGAFFLSLVFNATVHAGIGTIAALALGGVLIGLIVAGSRVSGAHYNPAVSLGALVAGRMKFSEFIYYQGFQIIGAIVGSFIGGFILRTQGILIDQARPIEILPGILVEFLGTFAWVYVWLHATAHFGDEKKGHHAWAIGFTFMAIYLAFYPVSGGACNPGLAISLGVDGSVHYFDLWIHLVGEFFGAISAASVFIAIERALENEAQEDMVDGFKLMGREDD